MYQKQELINDQYEVRQRLAGGMGYVYIVFDQVSQQTLAIKTLKDEWLDDDAATARFEREARMWINLGVHSNIVHAISFHRGRQPLLILEYVDGVNLRRIVRSEPAGLSFAQGLAFAVQIAQGLAFAHECHVIGGKKGVVHRDLKPDNIMVTREGIAKLTDFGIARAQYDNTLTKSGDLLGTILYMAPEQWEDPHLVTTKADIYSLGIVLYEMVAGMRPFPPASPLKMMEQTLKIKPEPVGTYRPDVDPELADLIACCLHKVPHDRPESARALARELEAIQNRLTNESDFSASCPGCGYLANREFLQCIVCGTAFKKQFSQAGETCQQCRCGCEIPAEYRFCVHCGQEQQSEEVCTKCGTTNSSEYQFCCHCGSQMSGIAARRSPTRPPGDTT